MSLAVHRFCLLGVSMRWDATVSSRSHSPKSPPKKQSLFPDKHFTLALTQPSSDKRIQFRLLLTNGPALSNTSSSSLTGLLQRRVTLAGSNLLPTPSAWPARSRAFSIPSQYLWKSVPPGDVLINQEYEHYPPLYLNFIYSLCYFFLNYHPAVIWSPWNRKHCTASLFHGLYT